MLVSSAVTWLGATGESTRERLLPSAQQAPDLENALNTREKISEWIDVPLFLEPADFDEAIIGVAERAGGMCVVAYDRTRVIDILSRDMEREEAEEFFEFNTIGAWVGDATPVFIDVRYAE